MIPIILIAALFLFYFFKHHRMLLYRKYELKLFNLRDDLRQAAIDGKIKSYDWTFIYLDTSISKMVSNFKMINIFHAIYLRNRHADDHKLLEFKKALDSSLSKNKELDRLYKEYNEILLSYLIRKHLFIFSMVFAAIYGYVRSITKIKKYRLKTEESVNNLIYLPETSTSEDFIKNYTRPAYC